MATKLSARLMVPGVGVTGVGAEDGMVEVTYAVRSTAGNLSVFGHGENETDAWEAVSIRLLRTVLADKTEFLSVITSHSDAPRKTVDEAVRDMHAAIWLACERGAKVVRGEVPAAPEMLGADPMGDE